MTAPLPHLSPATPLADPHSRVFAEDVLAGLRAPRKHLAAKYFYDRQGSALFEAITRLPEYYPTRTEFGILERDGPAIAAEVAPGSALVELGSGSTQKVRRLLPHLRDLAAYVPVDVSEEFLRSEAEDLRADFPHLRVEPVAADFTQPFALPEDLAGLPRAGFFPGSTIGNFEPQAAAALLRHVAATFGAGARLIVGVDLVKDKAVLDAAYDDAAGVTAAFNLNLLTRINREIGADFDLDAFAHQAFFDPDHSRIEMHLVSRRAQTVTVAGIPIAFASGETIHTENSYKYTVESFRALARSAGWEGRAVWTDPDRFFSVHALGLTSIRRH
ncbi:L-histidine N(alpha)-methyltransferase [Methylobacterium isbiliense]|uniref:Histidine N-alpha-methyltransferase n=1 Tax=Methylobacterium isbiliense TaxID=315478 RepID=A0ABQ4SCP9_9HYPH|nr:L-histidine N(alpha)-methyltransferase [Methylobacterium isbiliense]MDN3626202.1 L-histidine N(alpha)-methyltransferase [Methylobacterium isbiliense]GJE01001.1 Histidine N-alpha-methyltransferase [Methylobacterium isbiliense]